MHLYIHIPFCKQACHYCDFHFSTSLAQKPTLVAALCQEIILQKNYLPLTHLQTVYLGGGTPSLLTEAELAQIFETIHATYTLQANAEITLEANPDDLSVERLRMFRKYVNRLSIGLQSFDDDFLRFTNRTHTATESETAVKHSQDAGFEDISIDLMYGFNSKPQALLLDLTKAIALDVPHISAYNLTIEPQTVFGKWLKKGKISAVSDDLSAQHLQELTQTLASAGYEQYEISNFARAGRYARHNSSYWQRRPYIGIGPSAHSYNGHSRQYNVANNTAYVKAIGQQKIPFEIEHLTPFDKANDYLLTGLRTIWGCELVVLNEILAFDFSHRQKPTIQTFINKEWLVITDGVIYLTPRGRFFADYITSELFLV
jgi:oxygen-independent coproporphyrinogen III oxidase